MANRPARVFISYAHESAAHIERVRELWLFLRTNGIDAVLDLAATDRRQDWTLWMLEQLRAADFVVVVASPAYKSRSDAPAAGDGGRGVQFEGALLRELLYQNRAEYQPKLLPVLLPGFGPPDIPFWLGPHSCTAYYVREFSVDGAEDLLRVILGRPRDPAPALGPRPGLPARTPAEAERARTGRGESRGEMLANAHRTWRSRPVTTSSPGEPHHPR